MTDRMTRRWLQAYFGRDRVVCCHEVRKSGIDDGADRIEVSDLLVLRLVDLGTLVLSPRKKVSRVRKRRHPAAVQEAGVPAAMIEMQMCAKHVIDALRRKSCRREVFEEWALAHAEHRGTARLGVSDTGIDHDPFSGGLYYECLDVRS
jgi:hypothetical protein